MKLTSTFLVLSSIALTFAAPFDNKCEDGVHVDNDKLATGTKLKFTEGVGNVEFLRGFSNRWMSFQGKGGSFMLRTTTSNSTAPGAESNSFIKIDATKQIGDGGNYQLNYIYVDDKGKEHTMIESWMVPSGQTCTAYPTKLANLDPKKPFHPKITVYQWISGICERCGQP